MADIVKFQLGEVNGIIFDKKNESLKIILNSDEDNDYDECILTTEFILTKGIANIKLAVEELLQNKYIQNSKLASNYNIEYTFNDSHLTLILMVSYAEWRNSIEDDFDEIVGSFIPVIQNDYFKVEACVSCYPTNPIAEFKEFLLKAKKSL